MRSAVHLARAGTAATMLVAAVLGGCAFVIGVDEDPVRTDHLSLDAGDEETGTTGDDAAEPPPEEPPPEPPPEDPDV